MTDVAWLQKNSENQTQKTPNFNNAVLSVSADYSLLFTPVDNHMEVKALSSGKNYLNILFWVFAVFVLLIASIWGFIKR